LDLLLGDIKYFSEALDSEQLKTGFCRQVFKISASLKSCSISERQDWFWAILRSKSKRSSKGNLDFASEPPLLALLPVQLADYDLTFVFDFCTIACCVLLKFNCNPFTMLHGAQPLPTPSSRSKKPRLSWSCFFLELLVLLSPVVERLLRLFEEFAH
jgi:hypothetical protein